MVVADERCEVALPFGGLEIVLAERIDQRAVECRRHQGVGIVGGKDGVDLVDLGLGGSSGVLRRYEVGVELRDLLVGNQLTVRGLHIVGGAEVLHFDVGSHRLLAQFGDARLQPVGSPLGRVVFRVQLVREIALGQGIGDVRRENRIGIGVGYLQQIGAADPLHVGIALDNIDRGVARRRGGRRCFTGRRGALALEHARQRFQQAHDLALERLARRHEGGIPVELELVDRFAGDAG